MAKRTLPPEPPEMGPGTRIAGYRLESKIGAGGMAMVFRARDEALDRVAALKVIAPALSGDQKFRERFLRESRAAAAVDHPHIIPVYAAGDADGVLYLAMRLVAGGDLATLLAREGPLSGERAASLLLPIAGALDAAHASGLVHRDVKPGNILIDVGQGRPEHPYLTDFGLAKAAEVSTTLTATGQFLGTLDYIAPEQIMSLPVGPEADQYALACVTYTMLTGQALFVRDASVAVLYAHVSQPPPSVTDLRPDLSAYVNSVLSKALAKAPQDRFPTCGDFAQALRSALAVDGDRGRPRPALPSRPHARDQATIAQTASLRPDGPVRGLTHGRPAWQLAAEVTVEAGVEGKTVVDPDGIGNRGDFFAALGAVRQQADLSLRDVATVVGVPVRTVRGYFNHGRLPAERDVLRQILVACGVPPAALPGWEGALVRVRSQRQRGMAPGQARFRPVSPAGDEAVDPPGREHRAEADGESDLLFRIYIPKSQLYAEQRREMLRLFKEWLTGVQGQGVKHLEESTKNGDTVTFFAMPGQPHPPLIEEYREFASFVEHCAHSPATAVGRLAKTDIGESASADLVKKYSREYHRLELDLRQARETRILTLQHTLEAELLEKGADPREVLAAGIRSTLERVVPPATSALAAISASADAREPTRINMTFNAEHIVYTAIESVQGTANFGPQAKELMMLIDRYAGENAGPLRTALHELEDPGVPSQVRSDAKKKLRSFLADLARMLPGIGTDLLEKYLERKIGLA